MCGRGREGAMALALLPAGFQSLPPLPTIKLGPSGADSQVGGLVHALGLCGSLQRTLLWGWEFLLLLPQPPQVFSISGLRHYFPMLEPWVARYVTWSTSCCLAASCSFAHPAPQSTTSLGPPAIALPRVLSAWLPFSAPPNGLDECFLFISLVVGLPYSSIFCQFWLFFVFKFAVVLLLVVQGGTVCLPYASLLAGSSNS